MDRGLVIDWHVNPPTKESDLRQQRKKDRNACLKVTKDKATKDKATKDRRRWTED